MELPHIAISDWFVFFLTLLCTWLAVLIGHWLRERHLAGRTINRKLEYLLMGRELTLPLFIATLVATWYGGIFGVTQIAFEKGVFNFVTQGLFWYLTYIIFALFIVPRIKNSERSITLPQLLASRLGPRAEKVSAIFNFITVVPIAYTISIGLFIQTLFGVSFPAGMMLGVSFVILYSVVGGFRAIVFSDLFQFLIMYLGVGSVVLFSFLTYGGFDFLWAKLPAGHWDPTGNDWALTIIWGFVALSTLVDPNFYHRCFAAKDVRVARSGILWATVFWFIFDMGTTLGGMYARAVLPHADAKTAYLHYALELLPSPLKGLFLAGVVATILSTLDGFLFIGAVTLQQNLMSPKWRESRRAYLVGFVILALFSVGLALVFDGNIKATWKTMGSYSSACLLLPVMLALFFPRWVSERSFILASLLGVLALTLWKVLPNKGAWADVDEFYFGVLGSLIGFLVGAWKSRRRRNLS